MTYERQTYTLVLKDSLQEEAVTLCVRCISCVILGGGLTS